MTQEKPETAAPPSELIRFVYVNPKLGIGLHECDELLRQGWLYADSTEHGQGLYVTFTKRGLKC